jgi:hypothetical protein
MTTYPTNETVTINNRTYTVISRRVFGDVEYVYVEQKNGSRKTAQFYEGQFDCWQDSGLNKGINQFSRVNMRAKM